MIDPLNISSYIRKAVLLLLLLPGIPGGVLAAPVYNVDQLFDIADNNMAAIWELRAADFPDSWSGGDFFWSNSGRKKFYYSCNLSEADLFFLGMPVAEADFMLASGRLEMISLVLAARGIAFNESADPDLVRAHICRSLGTEWMMPEVIWRADSLYMTATEWVSDKEAITLFDVRDAGDSSLLYLGLLVSPYVGEYPADLLKVVKVPLPPDSTGNGILLDIPSSRQGNMDYCVPAAVSRIAGYYGSVMDCYLTAALTGCRDKMGVELNQVDSVLNSITSVTGLECNMLYRNPDYHSYKAIALFFERYNRAAGKLGRKRFPLNKIMRKNEETIARLLTAGLSGLDRGVLWEIRRAENEQMARFISLVKESICAGKPLLWCVLSDQQDDAIAFHLRIIHGLGKDGSILWSDSLAGTAETQSTGVNEAWNITAFLATLDPVLAAGNRPMVIR